LEPGDTDSLISRSTSTDSAQLGVALERQIDGHPEVNMATNKINDDKLKEKFKNSRLKNCDIAKVTDPEVKSPCCRSNPGRGSGASDGRGLLAWGSSLLSCWRREIRIF